MSPALVRATVSGCSIVMSAKPPFAAFNILRFGLALALIIAAVASFSTAGHAAVFGRDERVKTRPADAPLHAKIGTLVSSENGAFCTAFCVAPDLIATASHCLFGTEVTPAPKLSALSFKPASARTPASATAIRQILQRTPNIISGTRALRVTPPIAAASDWAVARLASPICEAGGLALSTKSPADIHRAAGNGDVYQIAVHADVADGKLRYGGPCALHTSFPKSDATSIARDFAEPSAILFQDCDTGGGSSGSPLLIDTTAGPEVVGINVGTYVLSRAVTTAQDANAQPVSEPIANTAIEISAIRDAVQRMSPPTTRDGFNSDGQ